MQNLAATMPDRRSTPHADTTSNLVDLLSQRAKERSNDVAFVFCNDGQTATSVLTYGQLDLNARAIAAALQNLGAEQHRALLLFGSGLEFISAFLGCLYASVVAVPCYPPRATQNHLRVQALVKDADAKVVLTTLTLRDGIQRKLRDTVEISAIQWIATDALDIKRADAWRQPRIDGSDIAFLQYTSGSTSVPKGVLVTHNNIMHNELVIKTCFGHTDQTIVAGWLPLFHDMGLVGNLLQPLYLGVPCILMSPAAFLQKPYRWLRLISAHHATTSGGPNFAYELCVAKVTVAQRDTLDLSRWRLAFSGSEPVRVATIDRFSETFAPCGFRREAFYPCYGMSETTLFATGRPPNQPPIHVHVDRRQLEQRRVRPVLPWTDDAHAIVGVGQPWLGQSVAIVDPTTNVVCLPDVVGEIWISGPSVTAGYWNRPEQTAQIFNARLASGQGPYLRTGDLGFMRDGELFVTGRLKDVIIIRGRNHAPEDIEATVAAGNPALNTSRVAAFSVDDAGEERLIVIVEVDRSARADLDWAELLADIREAIAVHHDLRVHQVMLVKNGALPKTSSGKVQRNACRERFLANQLDPLPLRDEADAGCPGLECGP
jgi:acyl-CoA synthetase (AMP-forming)/AMP-acid ligase II